MAINYTASLGLGKPVTGTESGTWGDDVNNAITSYLDIAVAGTLSFNGDGAVTLSQTFGTSSATNIGAATAQYMVLRFTGTTTTKVVTAPSVSKLYLVDNATGHGVTIKASGQTGYTVAANSRAWVFFNGTDYQYATTTETGVTPATSGGTGQSSYAVGDLLYANTTTTLAKLASVATGSVLRAKGVGTAPAWEQVVLTTDVTGVLPVANGGTGLSAPGALNNVLSSDGAGAWASTALSTLVPDASDTAKGVVELATTAEVQTGTDTTRAITPTSLRGGALVKSSLRTPNTTYEDFLSIPSWVKRITVMFGGLSTNGSDPVIVQIGTSSGPETTGYTSTASYGGSVGNYSNSTIGFLIDPGNQVGAAVSRHGCVVLVSQPGGNGWVCYGSVGGGNITAAICGYKVLASTLDRVRITTSGGSDVFDTGYVSILYE